MADPLTAPAPLRVVQAVRHIDLAIDELEAALFALERLDARLRPAYFTGTDHLRVASQTAAMAYRSLLAVNPTETPAVDLLTFFHPPALHPSTPERV